MIDEIGVNIEMARDGSFEPGAMAIDTVVAGKTGSEADERVAAGPLPSEMSREVSGSDAGSAEQAAQRDQGAGTKVARGKKIKTSGTREVLVKLADRINAAVLDLDDKTIKLAKLLLKSRDCFPDTRDGREEWMTWAKENIHLSDSRVRDLMRIAKAKDPLAEKKMLNAKNAKRQSTYRNSKAAALAASATSDALSDVTASPVPDEHEILTEKFAELARTWARGKSVAELQRVMSEITDSGDGFPEMPAFLVRNKSAIAPPAASANGGAVT